MTVLTALLVALVIGIPIGVLLRRQLLYSMPFWATMNGVGLAAAGVTIRPDQVVSSLVTVTLASSWVLRQRKCIVDPTAIWLGVLALVNVMSSVVASPALRYSLMEVVNLVSVWAVYLVLINFLRTATTIRRFITVFLVAGAVAASIGVVAFFLVQMGIPIAGANVGNPNDFSLAYGAYGTMSEPNLFGSLCQIYFVTALGLIVLIPRGSSLPRGLVQFLAGASAMGLFLSFTRGAWLGAAAGLIALSVLSPLVLRRRLRIERLIAPAALVILAGIGIWASPSAAGDFFRYKVDNLINPQSDNATFRLVSYGLAWAQYIERPLLGCGTYTFAPMLAEGTDFKQFAGAENLWIGNDLLLVLHDTGAVGLLVFLAILGTIFFRGVRAARRAASVQPMTASILVSLIAAFVGMLVSFLTSSGMTFTYAWVLIGLIGALTNYLVRINRGESGDDLYASRAIVDPR